MADAPLNLLVAWRHHLKSSYPHTPTIREVRERLSVLGPVDWEGEDGQSLLRVLCSQIKFWGSKRFETSSLGCLAALDQAGALSSAWGLWLPTTTAGNSTLLSARFLSRIPDVSQLPKGMQDRWTTWAVQALVNAPQPPEAHDFLVSRFRGSTLKELVLKQHYKVAQIMISHFHEVFSESNLESKVWADKQVNSKAWQWAVENGLDPQHVTGQESLPFWWHATLQGCRPAGDWAIDNDPLGAENFLIARYFKSLRAPSYREETILEKLTSRSDWPTLKSANGCSALWQACHASLYLTKYGVRREIQASADWKIASDEMGRNLAFAVLTSPDTNTSNAARSESLRNLAAEDIFLAPDGLGRGLVISWPNLPQISDVAEQAAKHPYADLWWKGSHEQVATAIRAVAHSKDIKLWINWSDLLTSVPPLDPQLRVLATLLKSATGAPNLNIPDDNIEWPESMDESPLMGKVLSNLAHAPKIQALRRSAKVNSPSIELQGPASRIRPRQRA